MYVNSESIFIHFSKNTTSLIQVPSVLYSNMYLLKAFQLPANIDEWDMMLFSDFSTCQVRRPCDQEGEWPNTRPTKWSIFELSPIQLPVEFLCV